MKAGSLLAGLGVGAVVGGDAQSAVTGGGVALTRTTYNYLKDIGW